MPESSEKKAAQQRLQEAIEAQIAIYRADGVAQGMPEDTGMVTDWCLVVHTTSYDGDGDEQSGYYMSYANGQMPDHRAVGLLTWAIHILKSGDPNVENDH